MTLKDQLIKLGQERNYPCITISFNTHRIHPDTDMDAIMLKNLLKEAESRVIEEYGKEKNLESLLKRMAEIPEEIDVRHNMDSLHIFLSDKTKEIIRLAWFTYEDKVHIGDRFDVRPLIKAYNRSEEYLIALLSQGGVHLYDAFNDGIISEIKNNDFPFGENPHFVMNGTERSNAKLVDDLIKEFYNDVDKALIRVHEATGLKCVLICLEENYSFLMQVADKPAIYLGYADIDYNRTQTHYIAKQAWEVVKVWQHILRIEAINEVKEAISSGKVLTDLQEIYQAAIDGRGDLLVVNENFTQPVTMIDERTFSLVDDPHQPGVIDDILSNIAWEVLSKNGRVFFTVEEDMGELGNFALKVRY
ncbi:MAG: hypothetical protein LUG18_10310 [Candidatus Azobacteroides sp.]|nr:hypothetical protein [Candidatus Azobacteroides sp.]